jgi:hypothetical protein
MPLPIKFGDSVFEIEHLSTSEMDISTRGTPAQTDGWVYKGHSPAEVPLDIAMARFAVSGRVDTGPPGKVYGGHCRQPERPVYFRHFCYYISAVYLIGLLVISGQYLQDYAAYYTHILLKLYYVIFLELLLIFRAFINSYLKSFGVYCFPNTPKRGPMY